MSTDQPMAEAIMDLIAMAEEPLDPELAEHVVETETFGPGLYHPLVHIPLGIIPGMANRALREKRAALAEYEEAGNWHNVVFLHERPYRCEALIDYVVGRGEDGMPLSLYLLPDEVRHLAEQVWVDSENIHQHLDDWSMMFAGKGWLFGDREAFDALPDPITAYRGDIEDGGWSYTTDRRIAEFFANRFRHGDPARIVTEQIAKDRVFGFLTSRNESELLVHPV